MRVGLLLIPFIAFVVASSMYFPFITGKNFAFRILIEILAFFWVWLMFVAPRWRPRFSLLLGIYSVFIAVLILATIFGLSPYKSFWSSYERMEGLFAHLHFFLYFLILGSVFASEREWRWFFNTSIAVSAITSLYALLQLAGLFAIHQGGVRVDATLGNATYLGVYLLFHIFFIATFFFGTENRWLKALYAGLFVLEGVVLYSTASRGPLLGFVVGAAVFGLLLAFLERGRGRKAAIAVLIAAALVPVAFYFLKNTPVVRSSAVLERFINVTADPSVKGRFVIWKMALKAWQERPVLGWGQESFVYIFSKFYDPSLWRNEPWFDRAHNVFLDWLTASGALGLAAYLAMFGSALYLLFRALKKGAISRYTYAGFSALLAAHFFQNLFVFDNLTSYILFFSVLAYIHSASVSSVPASASGKILPGSGKLSPVAVSLLGFIAVLIVYSIIFFNIQPMRTAGSIIQSLMIAAGPNPAGKVDALIGELRHGISLNTFGATELREQANQIGNNILADPGIAAQDKQKYLAFVIDEMERQRREQPYDVRAMAFLANAYSTAGRTSDALRIIDEVMKISTRRQQFYFIAAEAYFNSHRQAEALQALQTAYQLDPAYPEAADNLATVLISLGQTKEAEAIVEQHYGSRIIGNPRYAEAYMRLGDFATAISIWQRIVDSAPGNAQYHAQFGGVYLRAGNKPKAIAEIQKAIELEPRFRTQGEQIIKQIEQSK